MLQGWAQIVVFFAVLVAITPVLGGYMARVYSNERVFLTRFLGPLERLTYRVLRVDTRQSQSWKSYTATLVIFSAAFWLLLFVILRTQTIHPWNPQGFHSGSWDLSFNTAASFVTNTNWQFYGGETTLSYFSQMAGLAVQNFISAAVGIVVLVALIRGIVSRRGEGEGLGNFWQDLVRTLLYVLVPLSLVGALVLVSQGVIQSLGGYVHFKGVTGGDGTLAMGPVASQEAIKMLGTNGGGFFNANAAHPFENPTPFSNLIEMLSIFSIGAGLIYMFGKMANDTKQGWILFSAVSLLFLIGAFIALGAEQAGNPQLSAIGVDQTAHEWSLAQPGGNMEGKELRFGIGSSTLFATITTDASCGAVNGFHDSYTPIGGLVPLANIALGEIVFGGVGSGFYGLIVFAILSVFIAGQMVGRTPEYLGKKIEQYEIKMAALAILILPLSILVFSAIAIALPAGVSRIANPGPHGLSEILYLYTSSTGNNGSAFAGLGSNTPFYNWTGAFAMIIGRFAFIVPVLALAGSLVKKNVAPAGPGAFPTNKPLFAGLLVGVILIVGALTYFPAYALGAIVEQLLMLAGKTF
jgi:potassium-transporting ATPase potassium-binding subunit